MLRVEVSCWDSVVVWVEAPDDADLGDARFKYRLRSLAEEVAELDREFHVGVVEGALPVGEEVMVVDGQGSFLREYRYDRQDALAAEPAWSETESLEEFRAPDGMMEELDRAMGKVPRCPRCRLRRGRPLCGECLDARWLRRAAGLLLALAGLAVVVTNVTL